MDEQFKAIFSEGKQEKSTKPLVNFLEGFKMDRKENYYSLKK